MDINGYIKLQYCTILKRLQPLTFYQQTALCPHPVVLTFPLRYTEAHCWQRAGRDGWYRPKKPQESKLI